MFPLALIKKYIVYQIVYLIFYILFFYDWRHFFANKKKIKSSFVLFVSYSQNFIVTSVRRCLCRHFLLNFKQQLKKLFNVLKIAVIQLVIFFILAPNNMIYHLKRTQCNSFVELLPFQKIFFCYRETATEVSSVFFKDIFIVNDICSVLTYVTCWWY